MPELILVNGKPFFGRVEEQKRFRDALRETLHPPVGEDLPYVFLLHGDGGIGKTTLARRFRDIAASEAPFKGQVKILWVDWEDERRRVVALQVGREAIAPETVFDVLFTVAQRAGWEKSFRAYRDTLRKRREAEHAAARALATIAERPDLAALRGAGAAAIAKILRLALPMGETGEQLSRAFLEAGIQAGAEQAYALRRRLEEALSARLGAEQYDLYVNPLEGLARALADGLKRLAGRQALLVVLDTYEIVDATDPWLRVVMRLSGPCTLWVLSGRNDLVNSRAFGQGYFQGYAEEWPRRLVAFNMTQLAREDVAAYFAARVPRRPLDESALEALRRATRGIPLAVAQAAEMWAKGVALEDIVAQGDEAVPARDIVHRMTARYLVHAVKPEDRYALYALALARGDREVLRAMLTPPETPEVDLNRELRRLERAYASVYAGEARLHDDPQAFFEAYLRDQAHRDEVKPLLARGVAVLEKRLARIAADYDLIEERLADEDYLQDALTLTEYLFWLDEARAWRWLIPRFVEALAYSPDLRRGLLAVAARWQRTLSTRGRRRLKALQGAEGRLVDAADEEARLRELERLANRGYLAGRGEAERRAILNWLRGRLRHRQKRYQEALEAYDEAEKGLPPDGETLRDHLAQALHALAGDLMWPDKTKSSVYHPEAVRILRRVTAWQPENGDAWYRLGVALADAGQKEGAIDAYQKAIQLDEKLAYPWDRLGNVYRRQGRYDQAIAAYQKAIQLDEKFAHPWNGLGIVYADLGRYEEAIAAYQKAIQLDPQSTAAAFAHNNLAGIYIQQRRFHQARQELAERIRLHPENTFAPLIQLGVLARHQGLPEGEQHFRQALAQWERAWQDQYQSPAGLLANKAIALLCLGRKEEALQTLKEALARRRPGDTIELDDYELLRTAPEPPAGIEEMIALLKGSM